MLLNFTSNNEEITFQKFYKLPRKYLSLLIRFLLNQKYERVVILKEILHQHFWYRSVWSMAKIKSILTDRSLFTCVFALYSIITASVKVSREALSYCTKNVFPSLSRYMASSYQVDFEKRHLPVITVEV